MTIRPLGDRIMIKMHEAEETTKKNTKKTTKTKKKTNK